MSISYINGAIVKQDKLHNENYYDVSNQLLTAQFDGRGNISKYAVVNKWNILDCFYSMFSIDGINCDYYIDKEVTMIGRMQSILLNVEGVKVVIKQFVDDKTNAIFIEYDVLSDRDIKFDLVFNLGMNTVSYRENLLNSRISLKRLGNVAKGYLNNHRENNKGIQSDDSCYVVRNNIIGDFYFDVAMPTGSKALEREMIFYNQYKIETDIKADKHHKIRYVISGGTRFDYSYNDVRDCYINFDKHKESAQNYIDTLPCPVKNDDFLEAYYKSLINCSLSVYKDMGRFKGFIAGIVYQAPARTYYRDAYWTVLSVLPVKPEWVFNEIVTLSQGINKDGRCPSAVKCDFKNWWGDHYDSPSFFIMMIYDYIRHTGDKSILDVKWRKGTILDAAIMVIDKLAQMCDDTGLLVKGGHYNRRDWADNVFRMGYVTYDEVLYARALEGLEYLCRLHGLGSKADQYSSMYLKVRDAINKYLWDDKKGYYINFINDDYLEDNLSIDTVIAVLFGIADEERAIRMLKNMETMLETRNNNQQQAGDYGVMCAYPFYKRNEDVVSKSSLPYYYHNGADWPYWSGIYAYAKLMYKMDYKYPLTRWFEFNIDKGNYTPIEFYSPPHKDGSLLQGWSSTGAFLLSYKDGNFFR